MRTITNQKRFYLFITGLVCIVLICFLCIKVFMGSILVEFKENGWIDAKQNWFARNTPMSLLMDGYIRNLDSPDESESQAAFELILTRGGDAYPFLAEIYLFGSERAQVLSYDIIRSSWLNQEQLAEIYPNLKNALGSEYKQVRYEVAIVLMQTNKFPIELVSVFIECYYDKDFQGHYLEGIEENLKSWQPGLEEEGINQIFELINHGKSFEKPPCIWLAYSLNLFNVKNLSTFLKNNVDSGDFEAVNCLLQVISDQTVKYKELTPFLSILLANQSDERMQYEIAKSLIRVGSSSKIALRVLLNGLEHENEQIRDEIISGFVNNLIFPQLIENLPVWVELMNEQKGELSRFFTARAVLLFDKRNANAIEICQKGLESATEIIQICAQWLVEDGFIQNK